MEHQQHPLAHVVGSELSRVCRGLSHELSNILTFLLPALSDVSTLRSLLPAIVSGVGSEGDQAAALSRLREEFSVQDIERLGRQLSLAGDRLSFVFRDLRQGALTPQLLLCPPIDLWESLCQAVQESDAAPPVNLVRPEQPGPFFVRADPALLSQALGRVLRAATGWARMGHPQPVVRARLLPGDTEVQVRVTLCGDPERLPPPQQLLDMLCPGETGSLRAERGLLGVMLAEHLLLCHGGRLEPVVIDQADRHDADRGVAYLASLPLVQEAVP